MKNLIAESDANENIEKLIEGIVDNLKLNDIEEDIVMVDTANVDGCEEESMDEYVNLRGKLKSESTNTLETKKFIKDNDSIDIQHIKDCIRINKKPSN